MALPDRPLHVLRWNTEIDAMLLKAIGHLAVITAEVEELLHKIYWKHAGLNEGSGPIVTDNLNPKRLSEDILKLVALDASKINIKNDLMLLFNEMNNVITKRNHCLHWIWEKVEQQIEPTGMASIDLFATPKHTFQVKRPAYRQTGIASEPFTTNQVETLCDDASWLSRRLSSHAIDEATLRQQREEFDTTGTIIMPGKDSRSFADLFLPAPWLEKPLPPETTPSSPPETQK